MTPTKEQKIEAMRLAVTYLSYCPYLCGCLGMVAGDRPDLQEAVDYWKGFIMQAIQPSCTLASWSVRKHKPDALLADISVEERHDLRKRYAQWLINCLENP